MPAVNFKIRWPNGREATGYSPSTVIFQYLEEGTSYPLPDFLQRIESALNNASPSAGCKPAEGSSST